MARRRHAAAAGRILATGIALGTFGGAIGLMAGPAPAAVRTVAVPGPTHVVWIEVRHHPAPTPAAPPAPTPGSPPSGRTRTGSSPAAVARGTTPAPPRPAGPSIAPAPAAAPKPVTTTRAS